MAKAEERFPYELNSWEGDVAKKKGWFEILERTGPENVRVRLMNDIHGSHASVPIGATGITKGFAEEWLAWHDRQKGLREGAFRRWQLGFTAWAAAAATVAALASAIGWGWTVLHK